MADANRGAKAAHAQSERVAHADAKSAHARTAQGGAQEGAQGGAQGGAQRGLTTGEAAQLISEKLRTVSRSTVRRMVDAGTLRGAWTREEAAWSIGRGPGGTRVTYAGWRLIDRASVEAYIEREKARRESGGPSSG